ncbi:MAG: ABC transporter permease subunit [Candidatus Lokiarchaeota archaeon]|nr:ABC transporter permease subunit [Candidatus Lokiarchaeota archaeon]
MKLIELKLALNNTFKPKTVYVIFEETFWRLYSLKKFLFSLVILLLFPIFIINLNPLDYVMFGSISIKQTIIIYSSNLVYPIYFWTFGLAYASIISSMGAPLISNEVRSGTILQLVSTPIKRESIFLGKYLGLFFYNMILAIFSLLTISYYTVFNFSQNFIHLIALIPFIGFAFLYSVLINFLFTSITMALSSIMEKSRNVALSVIFLTLFAFLGLSSIGQFISDVYIVLQLYHIDLGYHMANIYIFFIESSNLIPPDYWQDFFIASRVFKSASSIDSDQNINIEGLEKTNYYPPELSLIIWLGISISLLIYGIYHLKKQDFSV